MEGALCRARIRGTLSHILGLDIEMSDSDETEVDGVGDESDYEFEDEGDDESAESGESDESDG